MGVGRRKGEGESVVMSTRLHTPPTPTMYRPKEFPVINKSTVGSAAVRGFASDPDGFYSLTSDIRQEQRRGGNQCSVGFSA